MPTATDIDNRPVAIGKWPRLRGSHNRNAAIISSNHALNRRNRAIANANSDNNDTSFERTGRPIGSPEEDEQSAKNWDEQSAKDSWSANASNGKHKDWCTLDNCISNCDDDSSNPCIDVLLNPELLQEFYGDKCKFLFSIYYMIIKMAKSQKVFSILSYLQISPKSSPYQTTYWIYQLFSHV